MTYASPAERRVLISGLRELADFLEFSPDVPAPKYTDILVFPPDDIPDAAQRREVDVIASRIGSGIEITSYARHYQTSRRFGSVEYRAVAIPDDTDEEQ
jgi:hypothetical protein